MIKQAGQALSEEEFKAILPAFEGMTSAKWLRDQFYEELLSNPNLPLNFVVRWFARDPEAALKNDALVLWFLEDPNWLERLDFESFCLLLRTEKIPPVVWNALKLTTKDTSIRIAFIGWRWHSGHRLYCRNSSRWLNRGIPPIRQQEGALLFERFCRGALPGDPRQLEMAMQ